VYSVTPFYLTYNWRLTWTVEEGFTDYDDGMVVYLQPQIYSRKTIFKMASVRHFGFVKF